MGSMSFTLAEVMDGETPTGGRCSSRLHAHSSCKVRVHPHAAAAKGVVAAVWAHDRCCWCLTPTLQDGSSCSTKSAERPNRSPFASSSSGIFPRQTLNNTCPSAGERVPSEKRERPSTWHHHRWRWRISQATASTTLNFLVQGVLGRWVCSAVDGCPGTNHTHNPFRTIAYMCRKGGGGGGGGGWVDPNRSVHLR